MVHQAQLNRSALVNWKAPAENRIKINVDAFVQPVLQRFSIGLVARNHHGNSFKQKLYVWKVIFQCLKPKQGVFLKL